ncbi:MAG: RHS repeat-associated core domain-containing protein [Treponema sp.]|jgi:RHS repeat-associated protein|nr:RHS repeat-associated core domain-containing protein [Treponema sp.]
MTVTVIRRNTNKTSKRVPRFSTKNKSYRYAEGFAHRASRIGDRHYKYDANGNVLAEQDAPFTDELKTGSPEVKDAGGGAYYVEGAWGMPGGGNEVAGTGTTSKIYRRDYKWDERNRLKESADPRYTVKYTYGPDGERTGKYSFGTGSESETLYFGKLWMWRYDGLLSDRTGNNSKHIFLGETRIATKISYADGYFSQEADRQKQYWYHSDHLGSAQLITNYKGEEYERLEYTPYGELWIEKASAVSQIDIPYRFTGKERDSETGLYYYGARYLDAKVSRWLSGDPAITDGSYIPGAPVNDEARKRNQNLPGMGGVYNYVNLHAYHYAGNNPVKYTDPDGRLILIDDFISSAIGNLFGLRDDGVIEGTWKNFENSWKFLGYRLTTPGIWFELVSSALWASLLGPIGFLTPLVNTAAGHFAIGFLGGEVSSDGLTTNIQTSIMGTKAACFGSVVIGGDVLYARNNKQLKHEQGHFMQSLLLGPLYWSIIAGPSLISAGIAKISSHVHSDFPTEQWANAWKPK